MEYNHVRYERLNQVVKKAVEQTIKRSLMASQLEACFPTISTMPGGSEALETARKQIQKYFHSTCHKQFEHIFAERDMQTKLDDLDEVIQNAQHARDSGATPWHIDAMSPADILEASVAPARADTQQKLALIYEQLAEDNNQLFQELQDLAAQALLLLNDVVLQVDGVANELSPDRVAQLDVHINTLAEQL